MTRTHKDLPGGSQDWADEVDRLLAENKALTEVVKRLCQNAGLDFSNPGRGISAGDMPSVQNPVGQKLSSLADVQIYNVADKQVLTWSQSGQKWLPTTPASGGAVEIPMAYTAGDAILTGYGHFDVPAKKWAYMGTNDIGNVELWGTRSMYLGTGDFVHGPGVSLIKLANDSFNRPYTTITAEDYVSGSKTSAEFSSFRYLFRLGAPSGLTDNAQFSADYSSFDFSVYGATSSATMGVEPWSAYITAPHVVLPQCTTATRPTIHLQDGSLVYDKTLKKPILYDFTAALWRDALGTAV